MRRVTFFGLVSVGLALGVSLAYYKQWWQAVCALVLVLLCCVLEVFIK